MTDSNRSLESEISGASLATPDPARAERNLLRFFEASAERNKLLPHLPLIARLFSCSQFLANFSITRPDELLAAVRERKKEHTRKLFQSRAAKETRINEGDGINEMMKALRLFKKRCLLGITLRDLGGEADIQSSMDELSWLAETIIDRALIWSLRIMEGRHGKPAEGNVAIIAFGKLGGEELNYSSDVDLMAVYECEEGQTSGVPNPSGITYNRISNHEFYCKTIETLNKMLSSQTEDGIAYRVDLRLRPQGQKGEVALPLRSYALYYESWGRTWERMMLIRARPVAGDEGLCRRFLETIRPFVWREALDFSEVEEIRWLKKQIDSSIARDDIKRGFGGIREAEFFVQTFQLLFGGPHTSLRTNRILNAIQALKWMKKVPDDELTALWENYLYLRRIEHYLQMKEDLQTHALPSSKEETAVLARKMNYPDSERFAADLTVKRMQINSMYNSLLGTKEDVYSEALKLIDGNLSTSEIEGYLSFRKLNDPERGAVRIKNIRKNLRMFHTTHERAVARSVVPRIIENALTTENPDRTLEGVENLLISYQLKMAHLTAFTEQKILMLGVMQVFSISPYLTRIFLSSQYYLDILIEEWAISKTLRALNDKLKRITYNSGDVSGDLTRFRRLEEVRLGMLLLLQIMNVDGLFKALSHLAQAIISAVADRFGTEGLAVVALGKLGGREMTFGSDLDIIFVADSPEAMAAAEQIVKILTAYTDMGLLYSVDTRLRPDGSRGILGNSVAGYRNYYMNKAQNWEIQALLKARPVGGNPELARSFIAMARDVIMKRGPAIKKEDISEMRARILQELRREAGGFDIKLDPGGVEEIEFATQYLQLRNAASHPAILVQDTLTAVGRLEKQGILGKSDADAFLSTYQYLRKLQTFTRLNEKGTLHEQSDLSEMAAAFMEHRDAQEMFTRIEQYRKRVLKTIDNL